MVEPDMSISLLRKFLAETTVDQRAALWAEVKAQNISGASISEYFKIVQSQFSNFNSSFSRSNTEVDDVVFAKWYEKLIKEIVMENSISIEEKKIVIATTWSENCSGSSGECAYAEAA